MFKIDEVTKWLHLSGAGYPFGGWSIEAFPTLSPRWYVGGRTNTKHGQRIIFWGCFGPVGFLFSLHQKRA